MLILRAGIIAEFECFMFYMRNIKSNRLHLGSTEQITFPLGRCACVRCLYLCQRSSWVQITNNKKKLLYKPLPPSPLHKVAESALIFIPGCIKFPHHPPSLTSCTQHPQHGRPSLPLRRLPYIVKLPASLSFHPRVYIVEHSRLYLCVYIVQARPLPRAAAPRGEHCRPARGDDQPGTGGGCVREAPVESSPAMASRRTRLTQSC